MKIDSVLNEVNVDKYKDLTISFSGFNIKERLRETIDSFLALYPHLLKHIFVFDDDSTDGTQEMLDDMGIKHGSWSSKVIRDYAKSVEFQSTTLYCSLIVMDIIEQCNTKYLFMSDGDITFYSPFLDKYLALIDHYPIVGIVMSPETLTPRLHAAALSDTVNLVIDPDDLMYYRVWQSHILFDVDFYKKNKLLYDPIEISYYLNNPDIDSGSGLMYQLFSKGIEFFNVEVFDPLTKRPMNPYSGRNNIFEHAGYASCIVKYGEGLMWN